MTFLVPLFLLGILAVGIPIWIHLTHREKSTTLPFPSLMFLRKIPYKEVRRRRLRHILLLSLRALALILLALAFARPFVERSSADTTPDLGPLEMVLLLDNSLSMGYDRRLDRAKEEAAAIINGLSAQDRVSIAVFSDDVALLNEPLEDKDSLRSILDGVSLSAGGTRFAPAIKIARRVLDDSLLMRKAVVLVSDYQRIGWEEDQDAWLSVDTEFMPVSVAAAEPENLTVADLALERDQVSGREKLRASVRVTRKAPIDADPVDATVTMDLNGRELQTKTLTIGANQAGTANFEPFTIPDGVSRGTVRLAPDSLPDDDTFHFVLWPGQSLHVLALSGPGRSTRRSLYIRQALAIGERPSYDAEYKPIGRLQQSDLTGRDVVMVLDVNALTSSQSSMLQQYVNAGGGLMFVGGQNMRQFKSDLLPGTVQQRVDRSDDLGGTLAFLDYSHPLFELFRRPHSGDFSSSRFFRYLRVEPSVDAEVLARFDDGSPALLEKKMGDGRALFWVSTLDTFWNDLSRQPVFLPFLHELVKYASGHSAATSWQRIGDVADLGRYVELAERDTVRKDAEDTEFVVTTPSGERTPMGMSSDKVLLSVKELGFYEIRRRTETTVVPLAVNSNLAESDLSTMDPQELASSVVSLGTDPKSGEAAELTVEDRERRQSVWWYLLVLAFILFVAETVLSNRLSTKTSNQLPVTGNQ